MARRNCKKNERNLYYALYDDKIPILDENGDPTFENTTGFHNPVAFEASLSTGKSESEESPFGNDVSYDRTIITCDTTLPISETSIIWVHSTPTYNDDGTVNKDSADYKVAAPVLHGLDSLSIAIKFNK